MSEPPRVDSFAINQTGGPALNAGGHTRFVAEVEFVRYRTWALAEIALHVVALTQCRVELGLLHHADGCVEHAKAHSAGYRMAVEILGDPHLVETPAEKLPRLQTAFYVSEAKRNALT